MHHWLANLRIRKKLRLFNLVTGLVSGLVSASLLIAAAWMVERGSATHDLSVEAAIIAENVLPAVQFRDPATAREILSGLGRDEGILSATLFDANGKVFARFVSSRPDTLARLTGSGLLRVHRPIISETDSLATLELVGDLHSAYRQMFVYIAAIAAATLFSLLVSNFVVTKLQRAITDPLSELAERMKLVTEEQDYAQRVTLSSRDELGELGKSFNRMIEQIQQRDTELGRELNERRRAEERFEHLAHHDPVTGLPNRHFFRQYTQELNSKQPFSHHATALLFVDIDNFKYVNDNFGHDCGDHLLTIIAQRLASEIRSSDLLVRFGGDEFVILLDRMREPELAAMVANKLLATLVRPVVLGKGEFIVTCSIGIAIAPLHAESFEELLQKADAAMYSAKTAGKNAVRVWEPVISDLSAARFSMESDLRRALVNHELDVHYQPIVHLATGRVVGAEALVRWRHPVHGYISPAEFIPVAEDCGLIMAIGEWMMETAFTQVARWNKDYGHLFIAVNVSARQFRDTGFVRRTEEIARMAGLARTLIELELTESMVMGHTAQSEQIMHELSSRGFSLSLDDFGTGYSSLAYLKRFPLDKLKIDRSFVKDLPHDPESIAIAKAIIGLAATLGMRVVAEGVETAEQAALLSDLHCHYSQGYHFSQALPADKFAAFMQGNRHTTNAVRIA